MILPAIVEFILIVPKVKKISNDTIHDTQPWYFNKNVTFLKFLLLAFIVRSGRAKSFHNFFIRFSDVPEESQF